MRHIFCRAKIRFGGPVERDCSRCRARKRHIREIADAEKRWEPYTAAVLRQHLDVLDVIAEF